MLKMTFHMKSNMSPELSLRRAFYIFLLLLVLIPLSPGQLLAAEAVEESAPMKVRVGFYVTSLHDLSLINQTYEIIFWTWFLADDKEYEPMKTTEIINAKSFAADPDFSGSNEVGKVIWSYGQFHAKMKQDWDISNYPFDTQRLRVTLEDANLDSSYLAYEPDRKGSRIDENISLPGWNIIGLELEPHDKVYSTSFGDPESNDPVTYSRMSMLITLQRKGTRLLLDNLVGTYVAFILAFLAFYVPLSLMSGKFSFLIAAIFAEVGNKYIIDSKLPITTEITLIDKIQWLTFACIALSSIMTIIIGHHIDKPEEKKIMRLNSILQYAMLTIYILLNMYWIARAL